MSISKNSTTPFVKMSPLLFAVRFKHGSKTLPVWIAKSLSSNYWWIAVCKTKWRCARYNYILLCLKLCTSVGGTMKFRVNYSGPKSCERFFSIVHHCTKSVASVDSLGLKYFHIDLELSLTTPRAQTMRRWLTFRNIMILVTNLIFLTALILRHRASSFLPSPIIFL